MTWRPALARETHRGERVGRLARLRDPDHEIVRADHRIAVAELGGDVHLDRDPGPVLDRVAPDQARVVGRATGDDDHAAQLGGALLGVVELAEIDGVDVRETVGDRLRDRVGLLVDLLHHEGRIAAPLGRLLVPGDLLDLALERHAGPVGDLDAVGSDDDDVPVLDLHHRPRLLEEGGDRGGEERLALAETDDQRALLTSADQQVGVLDVHRDERVVAAQIGERSANGGRQIALVVALDQVGDDLGVGLGCEDVALVAEARGAARSGSRRCR